jgi:hypothetical protein
MQINIQAIFLFEQQHRIPIANPDPDPRTPLNPDQQHYLFPAFQARIQAFE